MTEEQIIPDRLRRAETILNFRTERIILVLEQCMDSHNHQAVLRTAESLGVQNVWVIDPNENQVKKPKKMKAGSKRITKNCASWLSVRHFSTIAECIDALQPYEVWATDLAPDSIALTSKPQVLPEKLAVVIGRETDGVSEEMLARANKRIYLPMFGFSESLNLSVATALVLQRIFDWFPDIRGDLNEKVKNEIRVDWFKKLSTNPTAEKAAEYWLDHPDQIPALQTLRREKGGAESKWITKKIRKREENMAEVQQRSKSVKTAE